MVMTEKDGREQIVEFLKYPRESLPQLVEGTHLASIRQVYQRYGAYEVQFDLEGGGRGAWTWLRSGTSSLRHTSSFYNFLYSLWRHPADRLPDFGFDLARGRWGQQMKIEVSFSTSSNTNWADDRVWISWTAIEEHASLKCARRAALTPLDVLVEDHRAARELDWGNVIDAHARHRGDELAQHLEREGLLMEDHELGAQMVGWAGDLLNRVSSL